MVCWGVANHPTAARHLFLLPSLLLVRQSLIVHFPMHILTEARLHAHGVLSKCGHGEWFHVTQGAAVHKWPILGPEGQNHAKPLVIFSKPEKKWKTSVSRNDSPSEAPPLLLSFVVNPNQDGFVLLGCYTHPRISTDPPGVSVPPKGQIASRVMNWDVAV